jgi:hypothetical protein
MKGVHLFAIQFFAIALPVVSFGGLGWYFAGGAYASGSGVQEAEEWVE